MIETEVPAKRCETCAREWESASCLTCPVCGNEECLMLDQLGNYCDTRTAVALAAGKLEKDVLVKS